MLEGDEKSFREAIQAHNRVFAAVLGLEQPFLAAAAIARAAIATGNQIMFCGNGGSAADAQHAAAELVGSFRRPRRGLPALALSANVSVLTAISNDYGFDQVFSRQIEAHGSAGDVLIAISTSGKSQNIIVAAERARALGIKTIALLGKGGGDLAALADVALIVPADETERIQEVHIFLLHCLCASIEDSVLS